MSRKNLLLLVALTALVGLILLYLDPTQRLMGWVRGETFFADRPSSYWAKALTSRDPATQAEANQTLANAKSDAFPVLCEMIRNFPGKSPNGVAVRTEATSILTRTPNDDQSVTELYVELLTDPDSNLRVVAAKGLAAQQGELPENAISKLIDLLQGNEKVPPIFALSKYGSRGAPAIEPLRKLLVHADPNVRWNASRTLGKIGPAAKVALPDLLPHFQDSEDKVREHAAETIGDIGPEAASAIPQLEKSLTDPYFKVRRDASRSLGQLAPVSKASIPKLIPLLNDENEQVREAARKAIKILDPTANVEGGTKR
jgi:HEAT repeat protein